MGYTSACTLTIDGRTFQGTAHLEPKELLFRGDLRLSIPLAGVQEVHARDGSLFIAFGGRRAVLEVGPNAESWARRISSPPGRADKLGLKQGMRVAIVGVDDPTLAEDVTSRGSEVLGLEAGDLDAIFFAPADVAALDRMAELKAALQPAGALWVLRPKGQGTPIAEAQSMAAGRGAGLADVKVVAYSDQLTAEKYIIPVAERGGRRRAAAARRPAVGRPSAKL